MKRLVALFFVLFSIGTAYAEENLEKNGVFVPDYQTFMDRFYATVVEINDDLAEALVEKSKEGSDWVGNAKTCIYGEWDEVHVYLDEAYGYLKEIRFELKHDYFEQNEAQFRALIDAATRALYPSRPPEYYESLWEGMHYQYTISSPASYMSMHYNIGVYQYSLTKTSSGFMLQLHLSLYEY